MSPITTDPFWKWGDLALWLLFAIVAAAVVTNPQFGDKLRDTLSHMF